MDTTSTGTDVPISLPRVMQSAAGGRSTVLVRAGTVGEAVDALVDQHPDLSHLLLTPERDVNRFVNIYIDADDVRFLQGLDTTIVAGQRITLISAVAGG
ncbi:MoaD/ThiS family protein [Kineosporia sp. NBRC 101731]|uniref:MoaD/ThiS family protein n=1 Tax=Kineosporia sp. NBRC 101731 TaxID=3032199 RepID=UPI0024A02405|nr:MoaD/ThiS family protein [Kineosporia sp. NBRC 101731]GLY33863.1 molybdenum cofactor biosynthesis protein MoaD [Kineosporia sp. NBRC 101731]